MAFESKRLRVQLPCGETTVVEQDVQADFRICAVTCDLGTSVVVRCIASCRFSCEFTCEYTGILAEEEACAQGSAQPDPGTVLVGLEQLPVIREQLEAQLAEVRAAEGAVGEA
ncbi:MAG TPA: hypothetical protein VGP18_07325 [Solirubrobacteraceae bacterium]|jgi:hypothetical protein|nr:hypothetical protein [Solirubrobacteraceae bacterium]